jgi:peroxiredoxin
MNNSVRSLFLAIFVSLIGIQTTSAQNAYSIKIRVTGLRDSTCYLAHYYGKGSYISKDTAKADAKGNLLFEGKEKLPEGVYLVVLPKTYFDIIVAGEQNFTMETDTSAIVEKMKVTGSKENTLFYDFQRVMVENGRSASEIQKQIKEKKGDTVALKAQIAEIEKKVMDYRRQFVENNKTAFSAKVIKMSFEPEIPDAPVLANGRKDSTFAFRYYRQHFFDNVDFSDERMLRTPIFTTKIETFIKNLTWQIPDSINKAADFIIGKAKANKELLRYCIYYITNTYETSSIMGMDAVFVYMAEKYYLSGVAWWIDEKTKEKFRERSSVLKPLLLGKKAPNLYLTDTTGTFRELHKVQGKYIVLFFYDPDCGHCRKETPKLVEFWKKNKGKGITIYAANIERKEENWRKFIKEFKTQEWVNVWDSKTITDFRTKYDVTSTPQLYILDSEKRIIAKKLAIEQIEDFIENHRKRPQ